MNECQKKRIKIEEYEQTTQEDPNAGNKWEIGQRLREIVC